MPRINVMSKRCSTRQISLTETRTTLGRDDSNSLVIDSYRASRRHAVLIRQGMQVWVRDLDSSNGTWVNDERVVCCRLEHGDVVEVGEVQLRVLEGLVVKDSATMMLDLGKLARNRVPSYQRL